MIKILLITGIISLNAMADFKQDCMTARTLLGFSTGDLANPWTYTSNDYGSHGENVYSLKCEPRSARQKFITMTGYAIYESRSFPDLGCAVYDPSTGKTSSDWFTPFDPETPDEEKLYWCIKRLKERILSKTQSKPVCRGMRFACVDEVTDSWKCCHMGNH